MNAIRGVQTNLQNIKNGKTYDPESKAGDDNFGRWSNNRRRSEIAAQKERNRKGRNIENAERQLDSLRERLFDRRGRLRRLSNPKDVKKFREL